MRFVRLFALSSALVLIVTAAAKIASSFGHQKVLLEIDPVAGLPIGRLILAVGAVELGIAMVCLFDRNFWLSVTLIGWLSTNFLAYRIALALSNYHKPCNCLGNLTDALHISPQTADTAMKVVLGYLLVGSYAAWLWLRRQDRQRIAAAGFLG
jgi:drug/metabolite transporter superfamily protein YnfA